MNVALIKKEKLKKMKESIPSGERYEEMKRRLFNPPSFLGREKGSKRTPFYYIDVNIGIGKKGKIALYEGDDPAKVARSFAVTFQLSEDMEDELFQTLR